MLSNFFRINLPYGMRRNEKNEWYCFNREYKPLGFNQAHMHYQFVDYPIFTLYRGITEQKLLEIAGDETRISRDDKGIIQALWFYDDSSNPTNRSGPDSGKLWADYFNRIHQVSLLKVDTRSKPF